MNIKILHKNNTHFPKNFLKLKDCPEFIFVLGNEKILNNISISIVGARKASYESKTIARNMAKELSMNELVIVSGLAIGIDSEAHKGALEVDGKTIAVLGCGLDTIYPRENRQLAMNIIEKGGAIISEHFPDTPSLPTNLHKRNRFIAVLSEGIVVIEAKNRSGSLITAQYAKNQDKKVFVIPGGVNELNFEGSNQLLVDGAKCVRDSKDVLKHINNLRTSYKGTTKKMSKSTNINIPKTHETIYKCITKRGVTLQEICQNSNESTKEILAKLTLLEVYGHIKSEGGKFFKS